MSQIKTLMWGALVALGLTLTTTASENNSSSNGNKSSDEPETVLPDFDMEPPKRPKP